MTIPIAIVIGTSVVNNVITVSNPAADNVVLAPLKTTLTLPMLAIYTKPIGKIKLIKMSEITIDSIASKDIFLGNLIILYLSKISIIIIK